MKSERLDFADRWLSDAFDVAIIPAGFLTREVDMTRAMEMLRRASTNERRFTPTCLFLRSAALALTRLPKLHQMIVGNRRYLYDRVDLCLSVAGQSAMAPRLILRDAANKSWAALAEEVRAEAPGAREGELAELNFLRKWGWIAPFRWMRRAVLRRMRTLPKFRDQKLGTFQVSLLNDVDLFVPLQFGTAGILAAGAVRERVVAVDGQLEVRKTALLTCSFNHKVWDGLSAKRFLTEVADVLESGVLEEELPESSPLTAIR